MKRIQSGSVTGGKGFKYEDVVGAYFLTHLLIKSPPPLFGIDVIETINFQDKQAPPGLDDKVLITKKGITYVQVKSNIKIGDNEEFREFLIYCLNSFSQSDFDHKRCKFLLINGRIDNYSYEFEDLLKFAYDSNSEQFFLTIERTGSSFKKKMINMIKNCIEKFYHEDIENQAFKFLQCLLIKYLDFENANSDHLYLCIDKLRSNYKIEFSEADNLFTELFKISSHLNSIAGTINDQTLYDKLIDGFPYIFEPTNSNLLSFQEYIKRKEINKIFSTKFIGRKNEFVILDNFLKSNKNSLLICSSSGIGKTRLILEYISNLNFNSQRKFFYFHSNLDLNKISRIPSDSVVIIEDRHRDANLERIIEIFSSQIKSKIKLIIIERIFFKNIIYNMLISKGYDVECFDLTIGDIPLFLKNNYPHLQQQVIDKIKNECLGNFDYAIALVEYYNIHKNLDNLRNILNWKIEKYLSDFREKLELDIDELKLIINIISIVSPISHKDIEILSKGNYSSLLLNNIRRLFDLIENYDYDTLIYKIEKKFVIKPDPVSDQILLQMQENNTLAKILSRIDNHFPFRISANLSRLLDYEDITINEKVKEHLHSIWNKVNNNFGLNIEYFQSIGFLTLIIYDTNKELLKNSNILKWQDSFNQLTSTEESFEYINAYSQCLFDAATNFAKANLTDLLVNCVDTHRNLAKRYSELLIHKHAHILQVSIIFIKNHQLKQKYFVELEGLYQIYRDKISSTELLNCYGNMIDTTNDDKEINQILQKYNSLYKVISSTEGLTISLIISKFSIYHNFIDKYYNKNNIKGIKELLRELLNYKKLLEYKENYVLRVSLIYILIKGLDLITKYSDLEGIYEFLPQLKEMYSKVALNRDMIENILHVINNCVFVFNSHQKLNDSYTWKKEYIRISSITTI